MPNPQSIQLTPLQVSHAVIAVQAYMQALLKKNREESDGDEMNDYFVAQSILNILMKAGDSKDSGDAQV
ncbi:MAG: hypothetical protein ABIR54_05125 [Burkholderiaceae bacterium]